MISSSMEEYAIRLMDWAAFIPDRQPPGFRRVLAMPCCGIAFFVVLFPVAAILIFMAIIRAYQFVTATVKPH